MVCDAAANGLAGTRQAVLIGAPGLETLAMVLPTQTAASLVTGVHRRGAALGERRAVFFDAGSMGGATLGTAGLPVTAVVDAGPSDLTGREAAAGFALTETRALAFAGALALRSAPIRVLIIVAGADAHGVTSGLLGNGGASTSSTVVLAASGDGLSHGGAHPVAAGDVAAIGRGGLFSEGRRRAAQLLVACVELVCAATGEAERSGHR